MFEPNLADAAAIFGYNEMYDESYTHWAASVLGRKKIWQICHSLDKNEYLDYQEFLSECVVAVCSYLMLDVVNPPPELLLRNPKAYTALLRQASGKVLIKFLKYAGFPTLYHLWCARAAQPEPCLGLYAYNYHVFRSTCHKPYYVQVNLQHLCQYDALHPKLQAIYDATFSVSPTGKPGSNVYGDRLMEMRNSIMQQRGGLGGELASKLHTGPQLDILSHAVHVRASDL